MAGDARALARLASGISRGGELPEGIEHRLRDRPLRAHVIGVTGAPGAGKSSVLAELSRTVSASGRRIAVIAIDPSSPVTGGATLGDRIRMSEAALDPNVFVRSVAARGFGDALAPRIDLLIRLFDSAGYDVVAIETVGAGQDQVDVSDYVHTTVLVLIPGAGDVVQLLKAGSMEIADIYVVNKVDLPGARRVTRDLRGILGLDPAGPGEWEPPIVATSSLERTGFAELLSAVDRRYEWLQANGELGDRQTRVARAELQRALRRLVDIDPPAHSSVIAPLIDRIATGSIDPDDAALEALRYFAGGGVAAR